MGLSESKDWFAKYKKVVGSNVSKILYISDSLHRKFKQLCTNLGIPMQGAAEEAVSKWLEEQLIKEQHKQLIFKKIEAKLSEEEKRVLEALLESKKQQL